MRGTLGLLVAVAAVSSSCTSTPGLRSHGEVAVRTQIVELDARRFRAMTAGDLTTLSSLLSDDLVYVHSDGATQTKEQFLSALRSGELKYKVIEPSDLLVRVNGTTAVVTARSRMVVETGGAEHELMIRYTAVYLGRGEKWQLLSWQSTRTER